MQLRERFRGCLLGLAVGDAVGTTVEFRPRGTFPSVTDMIGGGPFQLLPGQWTDDTSMALCLASSLVEREGFDAHDQMDRYSRWHHEGYLSSTGVCFDIGGTVASALHYYQQTGDPYAGSTNPMSAGNGCIMRLAPISMFFYTDLDAIEQYAAESSRTTHGAQECVDACRLFGRIICRALLGRPKDEAVFGDYGRFRGAPRIVAIAQGAWLGKDEAAWKPRCGASCIPRRLRMRFLGQLISAMMLILRLPYAANLQERTMESRQFHRVGWSA